MTKVYYMGRRIDGTFKGKKTRGLRKLVWTMSIAFVGAFVGATFFATNSVSYATTEVPVTVDNLSEKVGQLKMDLLTTLSNCERAGHTEDDGLIVFDSNALASIGVMQFQAGTVINYYKKLYNSTITPKEAIHVALSKDESFKLAEDIIFDEQGGIYNWKNCAIKHGLVEQVAFIKKLTAN